MAASGSMRRGPHPKASTKSMPWRLSPASASAGPQLNADAGQPAAEIRLRPEQVVRGKLVDINGLPAAGVELQIGSVGRLTEIGTFDGVSMGNLGNFRVHEDFAPGRGRSQPTNRAVSRSPGSARTSRSASASATSASPPSGSVFRTDDREDAKAVDSGAQARDPRRGPCPRRRHRPADPARGCQRGLRPG